MREQFNKALTIWGDITDPNPSATNKKNLVKAEFKILNQPISPGTRYFVVQRIKDGTVKKIVLQGVGLANRGIKTMVKALSSNTTVLDLHLMDNKIGNSGARTIAEMLGVNNTLSGLDLGDNRIGDQGALALSDALKANKKLKRFVLNGNRIGDQGAIALAEALKSSHLDELKLKNNNIGDAGAEAFIDALADPSIQLTKLSLRGNSISANNLRVIEELLDKKLHVLEIKRALSRLTHHQPNITSSEIRKKKRIVVSELLGLIQEYDTSLFQDALVNSPEVFFWFTEFFINCETQPVLATNWASLQIAYFLMDIPIKGEKAVDPLVRLTNPFTKKSFVFENNDAKISAVLSIISPFMDTTARAFVLSLLMTFKHYQGDNISEETLTLMEACSRQTIVPTSERLFIWSLCAKNEPLSENEKRELKQIAVRLEPLSSDDALYLEKLLATRDLPSVDDPLYPEKLLVARNLPLDEVLSPEDKFRLHQIYINPEPFSEEEQSRFKEAWLKLPTQDTSTLTTFEENKNRLQRIVDNKPFSYMDKLNLERVFRDHQLLSEKDKLYLKELERLLYTDKRPLFEEEKSALWCMFIKQKPLSNSELSGLRDLWMEPVRLSEEEALRLSEAVMPLQLFTQDNAATLKQKSGQAFFAGSKSAVDKNEPGLPLPPRRP